MECQKSRTLSIIQNNRSTLEIHYLVRMYVGSCVWCISDNNTLTHTLTLGQVSGQNWTL